MKYKLFLFSAIFSLLSVFIFSPSLSVAQIPEAEIIERFDVNVWLQQDSSLKVEEVIEWNFGTLQKHGIFRNIPVRYKTEKGNTSIKISDVDVVNESGQKYQFKVSNSGDELEIKIGDPDVFVTGKKLYKISYHVKKAVNYFPGSHDELYWNAIGTGFDLPILKSEVKVVTPGVINKALCFTGEYGSTASDCSLRGVGTKELIINSNSFLPANNGLTFVLSLPEGTVIKPTAWQNFWDFAKDNYIILWPLLVLLACYFIWRKYGRDATAKNVVVAQYETYEKLSPMFIAAILKGSTSSKNLAAEIIYFATLGLLKIRQEKEDVALGFDKEDYILTKIAEAPTTLNPQSKKLFEVIFENQQEVKLSDLKDNAAFHEKVLDIEASIESLLKKEGYYKYNPAWAKFLTIGAGFFITLGVMFTMGIFGVFTIPSAIVGGIIIVCFAFIMPALTTKGAEAKNYILGFKHYMNVAEAERLKFHNAPEKTPEEFEKLLPYAIALGVEEQWAKQFAGLGELKPNWYSGNSGVAFSAAALTTSLNDFTDTASSSMVKSSSGDSGFSGGGSGGGGGGGGGGSW